jgi:membrane fusion protein (multidrug efflux system)
VNAHSSSGTARPALTTAGSTPATDRASSAEQTSASSAESADAAKAPVKKSKARPYVIVAVIAGVGIAGYGAVAWLTRGQENTDDAQIDADAVTVSARVAGVVRAVHVTDNQSVKKGDLLVEIDPADISARVDQATAQVAAARAQASAAEAQVQIVQATSRGGLSAARAQLTGTTMSVAGAVSQIGVARASLERMQSDAAKAEIDLTRAEALRKDEAIPQAQLDTARASAQAARAAVVQAQAQLSAAEDARHTAQAQIAEAQGRVEQSAPVEALVEAAHAQASLAHANEAAAEAALAMASLELSYTKVTVPVDGRLARLAVRVGQQVQVGQAIVTVIPTATYVVANFKETQVGEMHPGQRAEITIDALPGHKFEGRVDSISPGTGARFSMLPPDNASGNFVKVVQRVPVKIQWAQQGGDQPLPAGLSVDVTVFTR